MTYECMVQPAIVSTSSITSTPADRFLLVAGVADEIIRCQISHNADVTSWAVRTGCLSIFLKLGFGSFFHVQFSESFDKTALHRNQESAERGIKVRGREESVKTDTESVKNIIEL